MSRTHDLIHKLVTDFASRAWALFSPQNASANIVLSPSEYFRFCRAFYRVELFFTLTRGYGVDVDDRMDWFLQRYPPWENEQIARVYEYLQARFQEGARDFLARDVYAGEHRVDYLWANEYDPWMCNWLSHGIRFVDSVVTADSYEVKKILLEIAPRSWSGYPYLFTTLWDFFLIENIPSPAQYGDNLQSGVDIDTGPFQAWNDARSVQVLEESNKLPGNFWLRDRAYVLWDSDRLSKLGNWLEENPWEMEPEAYTAEEYNDMMDSFKERREI